MSERTVTVDGVRLTESQVRQAMRILEDPLIFRGGMKIQAENRLPALVLDDWTASVYQKGLLTLNSTSSVLNRDKIWAMEIASGRIYAYNREGLMVFP